MRISTQTRANIAAAFMALSTSSASAIQPSAGHADTMPAYGPSADKTCSATGIGTKKPGDWWEFNKTLGAKNIVMAMGNDCKIRFMVIDPNTLQLKQILSQQETMGLPPAKVLNAQPAPAKWWEQAGIIPAAPQGEPQISGPVAGGGWMCNIKIGQNQIQAAPGALIIPDATRAFFVTTRMDHSIQSEQIDASKSIQYGTQGKQVCTLEPLITLPPPPVAMTMTRGGLRAPGRVQFPNPSIIPATVLIIPATAEAYAGMTVGIALLNQYWLENKGALMAGGAIVYNFAADQLMAVKEAIGLSDTQLGQVAQDVQTSGALANSDQPSGLIQDRNQMQAPGNCTPQQHEELQNEVNRACKEQGVRSCSPQTTPAPVATNNISKAMVCIAARQKINNMCFMGGNDEHRNAIVQEYSTISKCIKSVNKP